MELHQFKATWRDFGIFTAFAGAGDNKRKASNRLKWIESHTRTQKAEHK